MHILFLDWPCFGHDDVLNFFKQQHFTVTYFSHPDYNLRKSITFTQSVNKLFETQKFRAGVYFSPKMVPQSGDH